MARCWQLLFVSLCVFASMQIGESLKCYDCLAAPGKECDNPAKYPNFVKECQNIPAAACVFRNTTLVQGGGEIQRNCGLTTDCAATRDSSGFNSACIVCQTDLCNSSSYVTPSMFIVSIVSVIMAKIYL